MEYVKIPNIFKREEFGNNKLIEGIYEKPGMKILDTHLGSGSSRIAAYDAGLDFTGYEINEMYFKLQEERFQKHAAQQNLFLMEGE